MMPEYAITPDDDATWQFDADDFAARIRHRWPTARTGVRDLPDSPMLMHALVPFDPPRRELGIALSDMGNAIILDPADADTAIEFTLWYVTQIPTFDPPVYLYSNGYHHSIGLRPDITADELHEALTGSRS